MSKANGYKILAVVQSLDKGGRTVRFINTVKGFREQKHQVYPISFNTPCNWVTLEELTVINKKSGIDLQLIYKLYRFIKDNNIDFIHSHCEQSQLYAGIAGKLAGIKSIITFHRSDLKCYRPSCINHLIKWSASAYISVSQDRANLLTKNLNFPKDKCHVVHGGTYITAYPKPETSSIARQKLSLNDDEFILLSIGHWGAIKGHQDTLLALAQLKDQLPSLKLYIAGTGKKHEQQKLLKIIEQNNLQNQVTFLGQTDRTETWLEAADIFIQPSREEAFGLVFIEAGAKAKPVIATSVGGIKEIIQDNITGLLVAPAAPEQLAQALQKLIFNQSLRNEMGKAGYQHIASQFSLANMIANYLKIFARLNSEQG